MILAALDDLMFVSRIRAAANGVAADVRFARTTDEVLTLVRGEIPTLVLLDLNARRVDPMATLAALKSDHRLGSVRIVGFVSHVQADVIAAARAAGIDEVLARSAFVSRLPDLLREDA
jgi:PleD family two-component response regulator